jgi:hypothetical protein
LLTHPYWFEAGEFETAYDIVQAVVKSLDDWGKWGAATLAVEPESEETCWKPQNYGSEQPANLYKYL